MALLYEVTKGEFAAFVRRVGYTTEAEAGDGCYGWIGSSWDKRKEFNWRNVGFGQEDNHPVICVSWNDAVAYTEWLSRETGRHYRLPTEVEWEYAARAGTITARYWGEDPSQACNYANVADYSTKERFSDRTVHNCRDGYVYTAPVGSFKPNDFGLYDMLGNAWEWTCSEYSDPYNGSEQRCSGKNDASARRSLRGGSWFVTPARVRAAYRLWHTPVARTDYLGFRLAQD
ncbi:hypothetical protein CCP3SC1_770002 [Gammaproteobacteria bacterium]